MTEPVKTDGETIINNGQPPVTAAPATEEAWWKEASEKHGFKTKDDMWKSYQEAEKKISEQGDKLKDFQLFQDNVVPVLDVVLKDKEMMEKVKGKLDPAKVPETPAPINNPKAPTEDPDTRKYLLDSAAASFDKSHGIDKLDPETQTEVKAKIGIELKKFTSETGLKVSLVSAQLEDAFALAVAKNPNLQKIFAAKDDELGDYGSIPSQSSAIDKDGNVKLSPEQEKVAEHMPGGREAYIKGLKKVQGK